MECDRCERKTYQPVTLSDGRIVCSSCEDWRHECEIRHVCAIPDVELRRAYLAGVEKKRGKVACDRLRFGVADMWKKK